jgi:hypothetical protein
VVERLDRWRKRRSDRIAAEQAEAQFRQLEECTFRPAIDGDAPATPGAGSASGALTPQLGAVRGRVGARAAQGQG